MTLHDDIDGRLAQGWGGLAPNGVHVNVVLARRGTPTAATIISAFTTPSDGYTPVLASLGEDQPSYQTLNPPTVILSKTRAQEGIHEKLIFGAAQVGIAQAVLDVVADGHLQADQEILILVSLWVDGSAADETKIKEAARQAAGSAVREAISGRTTAERQSLVDQRETLRNPFYDGH
jgi:5,6,7,8-tetrahydromethanopterin hydro-lyase